MKLRSFKNFSIPRPTLDQVASYLQSQLSSNFDELLVVLGRLSLVDNFQSFRVTVTIPATSEVAIENRLRGAIPTDRIITRSNSADVVDGDAEWTKDFVTLKNLGATEAVVTVIFLK